MVSQFDRIHYREQPGLARRVLGAMQPPRGLTPWPESGWIDDIRTSRTGRRRRSASPVIVIIWITTFLGIVAYMWWRSVKTGGQPLLSKEPHVRPGSMVEDEKWDDGEGWRKVIKATTAVAAKAAKTVVPRPE